MTQLRETPYNLNYQVISGNGINGRGNDLGYATLSTPMRSLGVAGKNV